ncbi:MAG: ATP-binding protein [Methanosarcinales archaeon]|nr:MAG: ATP-binding protein [Methanosarcinales archaeon]
MSVFIDRERELSLLKERSSSDRAEFVVIYGRRRIGKSELIDQFIKDNGIRLLAREESKTLQIRTFTEKLGDFFDDELLKKTEFRGWDGFFEYLYGKADERIIIAIDEFPYLIKEDPAIPSILQDYWDNKLKKTKIFLILCGSSISMMESKVMGYESPLYGRRTGQLLLKQIPFIHTLDYVGNFEKAVEFYSVFGGTPAYIIETDPEKDIFTNIEDNILREDSFLYRDVEFVLRQELTEPRYYFSILLSIAKGNHRIGLIANDTGLSISIVNKYLSVLNDLQLVYRMVPVTESYKSRKGMHFLADNLFDFWFKFVYPVMDEIEKGKGRMIAESIKPRFNQYVGKHFENIVQEVLEVLNERELLPFRFTRIGKWWHKEQEIDVVALNEEIKSTIFCECKWRDNVDAPEIIRDLRGKAEFVPVEIENAYYMVFAKSFRRRVEDEDVTLYDLEDMKRLFVAQ